ncbi:NEDD4-binding protein 2-like 1 isoform X2 [Pithys albifrons albifrons]|uniref:NEDD4-binding protein 2-like 1 isoform X2 n=1 Tax=Pithys albifrons albifrons TaxID=3385563 RepID=UPI003A5CE0AE
MIKGKDYESEPSLLEFKPFSSGSLVGGFVYRGCQSERLYGSYVFGDRNGRNIHHVPREKIQRMKEQYEHNVTFQSVLRSEKPSRDEGSYSGPNAAYGMGTHTNPLPAFSRRRPHMARTNNMTFN